MFGVLDTGVLNCEAMPAFSCKLFFAVHAACVIQSAAPMQPSNEQLEQGPLRREKLLEYLSWLEHILVPQLNWDTAFVGFRKNITRRAGGGATFFFKRT